MTTRRKTQLHNIQKLPLLPTSPGHTRGHHAGVWRQAYRQALSDALQEHANNKGLPSHIHRWLPGCHSSSAGTPNGASPPSPLFLSAPSPRAHRHLHFHRTGPRWRKVETWGQRIEGRPRAGLTADSVTRQLVCACLAFADPCSCPPRSLWLNSPVLSLPAAPAHRSPAFGIKWKKRRSGGRTRFGQGSRRAQGRGWEPVLGTPFGGGLRGGGGYSAFGVPERARSPPIWWFAGRSFDRRRCSVKSCLVLTRYLPQTLRSDLRLRRATCPAVPFLFEALRAPRRHPKVSDIGRSLADSIPVAGPPQVNIRLSSRCGQSRRAPRRLSAFWACRVRSRKL